MSRNLDSDELIQTAAVRAGHLESSALGISNLPEAPKWLRDQLAFEANDLILRRELAVDRRQVRAQAKWMVENAPTLESVAQGFLERLKKPDVLKVLLDAGGSPLHQLSGEKQLFKALARLVERARLVPKTLGRPEKAAFENHETYCALIVATAWSVARSTDGPPDAKTNAAQSACEAIWLAVGGKAHTRPVDGDSGYWCAKIKTVRPCVRAALRLRNDGDSVEISPEVQVARRMLARFYAARGDWRQVQKRQGSVRPLG